MRLEDFELRTPEKGEVAVQVNFAAINPIDWKVRNGHLKMVTGKKFPRVLGSDISGIVIAIGPGVTRFKMGDAVFGSVQIKGGGAFGQGGIVPETFLAKKICLCVLRAGACLGTPGITAWNGLVDKADLKAGAQVFINGCTGAVGESAVKIARMLGAKVSGSWVACVSTSIRRRASSSARCSTAGSSP